MAMLNNQMVAHFSASPSTGQRSPCITARVRTADCDRSDIQKDGQRWWIMQTGCRLSKNACIMIVSYCIIIWFIDVYSMYHDKIASLIICKSTEGRFSKVRRSPHVIIVGIFVIPPNFSRVSSSDSDHDKPTWIWTVTSLEWWVGLRESSPNSPTSHAIHQRIPPEDIPFSLQSQQITLW